MMTEVVGLSHVKACRLSVSTDEVIVPSKKYQGSPLGLGDRGGIFRRSSPPGRGGHPRGGQA